MDKLRIRQAIVVEGKYDQNALRQLVDTAIFTTNGFTGMKDPALLRLLRQAAETTGLIILTDSDGAGFLIRNTLKSALPAEGVLHAYIPDIPGKERRKTAPGKEGLLGVEGMRPEILLQALRNAGADFEDAQAAPAREPVTKQDFFTLGLSGRPDSAAKRAALLQALSLPAHMSANALLQAVNVLFSRRNSWRGLWNRKVFPARDDLSVTASPCHLPWKGRPKIFARTKGSPFRGAVSRRLTERLSLYRTAFQTET
ncbi:MAG: DUF4093 domain-containing protein [Oscillospiraceae bacterium]